MTCKKCNKQIENDSKFCQFCGLKVLDSDIEQVDKQFIEHLEFLGYTLDEPDIQESFVRYIAKHKSRSNLLFNAIKDVGISFASFYTLDENKVSKDRNGLLEVLNIINNRALFCSFSISTDNALVCAALYLGKYGKKEFADFLELYEGDIQRAIKSDSKLLDYC